MINRVEKKRKFFSKKLDWNKKSITFATPFEWGKQEERYRESGIVHRHNEAKPSKGTHTPV